MLLARRTARTAVILTVACLAHALLAFGQQPPATVNPIAGTGQIKGTVVAADTGLPVRRVIVRLSGPPAYETITDMNGAFEFSKLPAARFRLTVLRGGFVQIPPAGQPFSTTGQAIELAAGQRLDGVRIRLARGGVLTGRVFDEFGDAVPEARIQVYRVRYAQGLRRLMVARTTTANDIGQYRVYGLQPGTYYLSGTIPAADTLARLKPFAGRSAEPAQGLAPTYFPGVLAPDDARAVAVDLGQEIANLDFGLQPVRLLRVSGTVFDSQRRPAGGTMVMLNSARPESVVVGAPMHAETTPDGRFTIAGVVPGEYRVDVRSKASLERLGAGQGGVGTAQDDNAGEFASIPLAVLDDLDGVLISTSRGLAISGRLVVEGAQPDAAEMEKVRVTSYDANTAGLVSGVMLSATARVQPDFTFQLKNILGRRVLRVTGLPAGWALKAVRADGMDVTDSGIDIRGADVTGVDVVVTARPATVAGTITDSQGKPAPDRAVVVFPEDRGRWTGFLNRQVRWTKTDAGGAFTVGPLPPGTYLAAITAEAADDDWAAPENLERLRAAATRFSVAEGESRSLQLTVK